MNGRQVALLPVLGALTLALLAWAVALLAVRDRPDALAWWIPGIAGLAAGIAVALAVPRR